MTNWDRIKQIKLGHRRSFFGKWMVERVGTKVEDGDALVVFKTFDAERGELVPDKEIVGTVEGYQAAVILDGYEEGLSTDWVDEYWKTEGKEV